MAEHGVPNVRFALGYPIVELDPDPAKLTSSAVATIARAAEDAGFDALSFTEHPAPDAAWRDGHGHDAIDPFIGLAFAAAATSRLRLVTYVAVVPYHPPLVLAKTAASLDRLSGGRLILGVGTGYQRGEFRALGQNFDRRNEVFERALDLMQQAWTGERFGVELDDSDMQVVVCHPTPLQAPRPLIWVGGNSRLSRLRVARHFDGWMPIPTNPPQSLRRSTPRLETDEDLAAMIVELRGERRRVGRSDVVDVLFGLGSALNASVAVERVGELAAMGVTWISASTSGSLGEVLDWIGWFGREVIAAVRRRTPPSASQRAEIVAVLQRYAAALDNGNQNLLRSVFTDDVVADYGASTVAGLEALLEMMARGHRDVERSRHRILDVDIELHGNTATVRSTKRNTLVRRDGDAVDETDYVGTYVDELVLTPAGWRIRHRTSRPVPNGAGRAASVTTL